MAYDYDGWAPCIHKEEELPKAEAFIKDQTPDFTGNVNPKFEAVHGGVLEDMIWELTDLTGRGDIQMDCDQWWGVFVTGTISDANKIDHEFKTMVQADTLLLGVAETLRWWREKYKELRNGDEKLELPGERDPEGDAAGAVG